MNRSGAEELESTKQRPSAGSEDPPDKTPQEFYAELARRADVREILEGLAAE